MQVVYETKAQKDLRCITSTERNRIIKKILQYADSPEALENQVKYLTNSPFYRLRVGSYRVIFTLREDVVTIMIVARVQHRREVYDH